LSNYKVGDKVKYASGWKIYKGQVVGWHGASLVLRLPGFSGHDGGGYPTRDHWFVSPNDPSLTRVSRGFNGLEVES